MAVHGSRDRDRDVFHNALLLKKEVSLKCFVFLSRQSVTSRSILRTANEMTMAVF